jgi:hypothetical protein
MNYRIKSVAMCQPAVRMVVVEAWVSDGKEQHEILPVVGIQAAIVRFDEDCVDEYGDRGPDQVRHTPVVCDAVRGGITTLSELRAKNPHHAYRLAICPWPQAKDEKRLADVIRFVQRQAMSLFEENEAAVDDLSDVF